MKRWIIIGAVLTALGGGIASAGCTTNADGSVACDLSGCSYSQNGSTFSCYTDETTGDYTCNQCAFGDQVFDCTDPDQQAGCMGACASTCIGNCIEQNCGDCGAANCNGCELPEACEEGYWITRELVEGEDYEIEHLYVTSLNANYSNSYDLTYTLQYSNFSKKFHNIITDIEILFEGEIIATSQVCFADTNKPYRDTVVYEIESKDAYGTLAPAYVRDAFEIRIVRVIADEYILK